MLSSTRHHRTGQLRRKFLEVNGAGASNCATQLWMGHPHDMQVRSSISNLLMKTDIAAVTNLEPNLFL
jgi:hypothetical protein